MFGSKQRQELESKVERLSEEVGSKVDSLSRDLAGWFELIEKVQELERMHSLQAFHMNEALKARVEQLENKVVELQNDNDDLRNKTGWPRG